MNTPRAEHPGSFGTLVHKRWRSTTQRATRCVPLAHRSDVHELRAGSNCNIPRSQDSNTPTRPQHRHHANNVHPAAPNKHHKRPLSLKECRWTRALQLEPRGCVSTHHTTNFQLCSRRDNRHLGTTLHPRCNLREERRNHATPKTNTEMK